MFLYRFLPDWLVEGVSTLFLPTFTMVFFVLSSVSVCKGLGYKVGLLLVLPLALLYIYLLEYVFWGGLTYKLHLHIGYLTLAFLCLLLALFVPYTVAVGFLGVSFILVTVNLWLHFKVLGFH